jgi:ribosomal protein S18 acetylase RimI-like enzyme
VPPVGPTPVQPAAGRARVTAIVRAAESADLDALADLLTNCFHDRSGWFGWLHPFFRMGIYEDLRIRIRRSPQEYRCWIAIAGPHRPSTAIAVAPSHALPNELVGTVELSARSSMPLGWNGGRYPYIANLAVRPDCRRRGVAKQLLAICEATAQEWGFQDIYLHVLDDNQAARRLYERLGYRCVPAIAAPWPWSLGRPQRLFLHKRLA